MFVQVTGFGHGSGILLPESLRNPSTNTTSMVLALIRWLSPHPNALLTDERKNPICPAPFDINHALWTFYKLQRPRASLSALDQVQQLHMFPGSDDTSRRDSVDRLSWARYDLIQLETIEHFMNCTFIDGSQDIILETLTLPF